MKREEPSVYGILAEFHEPEALLRAAESAYEAGYRCMDAYSPFPVEGLAEAIGFRRNRVALITLCGGIAGALTGFGMQCYSMMVDYPLNIAGRPYFSWPAFIPITFELSVLFAALSGAFGMLALNRLPQPYHPVFNDPHFVAHASRDRFYLCILARDPLFDRARTRELLGTLGSSRAAEVSYED